MIILGIESSCDDTAVAVVEALSDEKYTHRVLSSIVNSQDDIHGEYGGIVPELASRKHIEDIIPVVEEALKRAGITIDQVDAIGVTQGPGLVGSILIGLSFAKSLAYSTNKPFVGVNHIEAHPLAVFLNDNEVNKPAPNFPFVALIVSGGHTSLMLYKDFTTSELLGQTRDDAVGEAFDKVAKLLGLGYPGGRHIDRLAKLGIKDKFKFKRTLIEKNNLEFSFSGIKTAVLTEVKKLNGKELTEEFKQDISASFQEAVVDVLVQKALWAMEAAGTKELVIAGGVASNSRLRLALEESSRENNFNLYMPPPHYCSDNGAMIAVSAYHLLKEGFTGDLTMNAKPNAFNVKEQ